MRQILAGLALFDIAFWLNAKYFDNSYYYHFESISNSKYTTSALGQLANLHRIRNWSLIKMYYYWPS